MQYTTTLEEYGDLVSQYSELEEESSFYQADVLGSTDALLNPAQEVTDRYQYTAFGLPASHTGSSEQPLTYVGGQGYYHDVEGTN